MILTGEEFDDLGEHALQLIRKEGKAAKLKKAKKEEKNLISYTWK